MPSRELESEWCAQTLRFAPDHPTAAGHFPGDPIIPGALLLAHMLDAIMGAPCDARPYEVRFVKFLRPVRPGDQLTLRWRPLANGEQQFEAWRNGHADVVMSGSVRELTLELG